MKLLVIVPKNDLPASFLKFRSKLFLYNFRHSRRIDAFQFKSIFRLDSRSSFFLAPPIAMQMNGAPIPRHSCKSLRLRLKE